ncbi:MAG: proline/glycine betaine ABC transporter permease [Candidatus Methanomethylophilaceae archaeon]|nr:proline/glycine betaine ABC transporter permease [Candidatus Methanomethylophilaceae archaeon]
MVSIIGSTVEDIVDILTTHLAFLFTFIADLIQLLLDAVLDALFFFDPTITIVIIALVALLISRRLSMTILTFAGLLVIEYMDLWTQSMHTLGLVLVSAFIALLIGIPLGIIASKYESMNSWIKMLMDFMQTMPSFVYLIPAVIFFGLGAVPGAVATVIFAMPPAVRLTNLGIRQVPKEMNEVADAFGCNYGQKLFKVQLPIAMPSIMAGVNQTIMLSLSMVVIAGMIGAAGLGQEILRALSRIDVGAGFEAGLAVVILAIMLDRLSYSFSERRQNH